MILLDENIAEAQRDRLQKWKPSIKQIGYDISRKGIEDSDIVPFILSLPTPTLLTRDRGFYRRKFCHRKYGLVFLDVHPNDVAFDAIPFLRHVAFNTNKKRIGKVVRVSASGISMWVLREMRELHVQW